MVAIMLIDIALNTHDLISDEDIAEEDALTKKQLTVLAGDYYSGLYYYILSHIGAHQMTQILASSIKEINEQKVALHLLEDDSIDHLIATIERVDTTLFTKVAKHVQSDVSEQLIKNILTYDRLIREKDLLLNDQEYSIVYDWVVKNNCTITSAINFIDEAIHQKEYMIEDELLKMTSNETKSSIQATINKLMYKHTSVAEEG